MSFVFRSGDVRKLQTALGVNATKEGTHYRFELVGKERARHLILELYSNIPIGNKKGNLVSVYTESAHLQLHFCSGYVVSKMLGEVTFIGENSGKLSGLIIEKEGGCSLYANVDRSLLSGDFTQLGPEVMLSGIALSLTDGILDEQETKPKVRPKRKPVKKARR
ncbi:MAG: hypothetical protein ACKVRP_07380 [Bacteroidota bacterium]